MIADLVSREFKARTLRQRFVPLDISRGPKWAMMLYLAEARELGRRVSATELTHAGEATFGSGLRYIARLVEAGFAERLADKGDGRRTIVRLTDEGWSAMRGYAERMAA